MDVVSFGRLQVADPMGRRDVEQVSLQSSALSVSILSLGASLRHVDVPDRHGRRESVHLAMEHAADYEDRARNAYLGATVGRYANRIAEATFELDGRTILLETNDGPHHLHGGPDGFARRIWDVVEVHGNEDGGVVVLSLTSPDGDAGYPGTLHATATYELHGHTLTITYEATTDAPTVVNLCSHGYWNLGGRDRWTLEGSIADHELRVAADHVLPAGADSIPVGPLVHVADTDLDLRLATLVDDLLARRRHGVDHSYALDPNGPTRADGLRLAAELHHDPTGRTLTVATDQPAVHVYTANRLGPPFARHAAVCLETQRFPDAPNRAELGRTVLRPGEHYRSRTALTFGVR